MPRPIHTVSFQMQRNIDYILNYNHDETGDIIKPSFEIGNRQEYGHYKMTCRFFGIRKDTLQPFELYVNEIKLFEISQDFVDNYTDEISLIVELSVLQLIELINDFKDLKVEIQLYPCSNTIERVATKPTFTKVYRAIFKDKTEILKKIPKESLIPKDPGSRSQGQSEMFITTEFQLMEERIHSLRNKSINYLMRNCTVRDIILNCCALFGIKKISFVEPHNTQVYDNAIIPPLLSFEQTFSYINEYFGVYNTGYSFYYSEDILYIYPTYDYSPKYNTTVHVYNGGEGMYPSLELYHATDKDGNTHIVTNSYIEFTNLQDSIPENIGTHFIGFDVDHVIDHTTSIKEGAGDYNPRVGLGKLVSTRLKTYVQSSGSDDVGMKFNLYKPTFLFDWNNKYTIPSQLASYRGSLLSFGWECAVPYTFKPGYQMYYHYDDEIKKNRGLDDITANNYKYSVMKGTCLKALYRFEPRGRYTNYLVMHGMASVMCFMQSDKVITESDVSKHNKENPDEGIIRMK